ncbi:MAG TPA: hypothetical protein VI755_11585 [Anaerolineales bacterium]|nr:hypothetical protein [Anaerolineales bacterium]
MAKRPRQIATREAFLNSAKNLKRETVEIDGLGAVYVRELTGRQMVRFNEQIDAMKANGSDVNMERAMRLAALLVSMSVSDGDGNLLFTEADVETLSDLPFEKLRTVADKALELSGVHEVASNLKKALDSSTTDSPRSSTSP